MTQHRLLKGREGREDQFRLVLAQEGESGGRPRMPSRRVGC